MTFRILVSISAHGYGHLAMTAPVINRLAKTCSAKFIIRSTLPAALIREFIPIDIDIINEASDFGMVMKDSFEVDLAQSKKRYNEYHKAWGLKIEQEAQCLKKLQADFILSSVSYLTIAAAKQIGVPCVGYCSLNWADIYQSFFGYSDTASIKIVDEIRRAYQAADYFVTPAPSMPMEWLQNRVEIGPVARVGKNIKKEICARLSLSYSTRLVLVAPGGVKTDIKFENWPTIKGIHWIVSGDHSSNRNDITCAKSLGAIFNDILASCDAIITKPGYGMVTDTVCNNIPVLYAPRGNWAEEKFLVEWWQQNGSVIEVSREQFFRGDFSASLEQLWSKPLSTKIEPSGINELVNIVSGYIPNKVLYDKESFRKTANIDTLLT